MVTAELAPNPATTGTDEPNLTHIVHGECTVAPQIGYCGTDLTGPSHYDVEWDAPEDDDCLVCLDLVEQGRCPHCGEQHDG